MVSLEELKAIRERMRSQLNTTQDRSTNVRILVGMGTCGLAAGAQPVLTAFTEEIERRNLRNIQVSPTGCIGVCRLEPIVEVYMPGDPKVTYVKMTAEKVLQVLSEHVVNGQVVTDLTIGAAE